MPIATEGIIDREWANLLKSWIDGDRHVDYYIERRNTGINIPIEQDDSDWINNSFAYLDSITGLRIRETFDPNDADIFFTQVDAQFFDNPIDEGTLGYTELVTNDLRDYFDIVYVDDETNDWETANDGVTINHETAHALGLAHPYGDGFNSNFTTDDTIMSYNIPTTGGLVGYTESDIRAFKHLWGEAGTNYDAEVQVTNPDPIPTPPEPPSPETDPTPAPPQLPAEPDAAIVASLVSGLWLKPKEISSDSNVTYYIDKKGKYRFSRWLRANGKSSGVSKSEASFIREFFAQIDAVIPATVTEVKKARKADIVIGSLVKRNTQFTEMTVYWDRVEVGWGNEGLKELTTAEKGYIGKGIANGFGLRHAQPEGYSTLDTIMALHRDNVYYGLTINDKAALNELWTT